MYYIYTANYLAHHGILGQKWGVRRYQNKDGTLTQEGRHRLQRKNYKEIEKLNRKEDTGPYKVGKNVSDAIDEFGKNHVKDYEKLERLNQETANIYDSFKNSKEYKKYRDALIDRDIKNGSTWSRTDLMEHYDVASDEPFKNYMRDNPKKAAKYNELCTEASTLSSTLRREERILAESLLGKYSKYPIKSLTTNKYFDGPTGEIVISNNLWNRYKRPIAIKYRGA